MIALSQLQNWLLDESLKTKNPGRKRAIALILDETRQAQNAIEVIDHLSAYTKELKTLITLLSEKVMQSYQWDIWGYYPLERLEGPYDRETAHQRMLQLNEQTNRPHIRVVLGSEREQRYREIIDLREQQQKEKAG